MRAALSAVALLGMVTGCSGPYSAPTVSAKVSSKPLSVRVQPVTLQNIPEVITATGELFAEDLANISAKVPGRVSKLNVDLGSQVEAGQTLVELEKDDYQFRVKQAEALVEQTRARLGLTGGSSDEVTPENTAIVRQAAASLKEARLMFANSSRLVKEGVVSRVDFERAQVNFQAAEARYQAAMEETMQARAQLSERRAQLALARQQLSDTEIRAPFRGAITRRLASLGEYLAVNAPVVTLVRLHPLRLCLDVPERLATKVSIGQRVDVRLEGSDKARAGRVVRLSPAIEAQNRSLLVEGEIPNQDGALRPGSFAEGVITVNLQARGVAIPARALVSFAGVDRVFVNQDGVLAERIVKPGRKLSMDRVEILSGLKPGELVVTEANDRLANGQKVEASGL